MNARVILSAILATAWASTSVPAAHALTHQFPRGCDVAGGSAVASLILDTEEIRNFASRWDNGSGWPAGANDKISISEIEAAGGAATMSAEFAQLSPAAKNKTVRALQKWNAREMFWNSASPDAADMVRRYDVGYPSLLGLMTAGEGDYYLYQAEIDSVGADQFVTDMGRLSSEERATVVSMLAQDVLTSHVGEKMKQAFPAMFNANDFGNALFTNANSLVAAEEARGFLRGSFGIDPFKIQDGLQAGDLGGLTCAVPSTTEEQFIVDLRNELALRGSMNLIEFANFKRENFPRTPQLTVSSLITGIAQDPDRFLGNTVDVTGPIRSLSEVAGEPVLGEEFRTCNSDNTNCVDKAIITKAITRIYQMTDRQDASKQLTVKEQIKYRTTVIRDPWTGYQVDFATPPALSGTMRVRGTVSRAGSGGGYELEFHRSCGLSCN